MTPEREADIRTMKERYDDMVDAVWQEAVDELLSALDAERAEVKRLRAENSVLGGAVHELQRRLDMMPHTEECICDDCR